jgi:hypothetical protein
MDGVSIEVRFDARYQRNYYINSVTKKTGWTVQDVATAPPMPPAAPPPNPYPYIQQRHDPRYNRNYYFNTSTKKSGWTIDELLTPEVFPVAPPVHDPPAPSNVLKKQMGAYGRGARRRSMAGKRTTSAPHTQPEIGQSFTKDNLDDTYELGLQKDREEFFLNRMKGRQADFTAISRAERHVELASSAVAPEAEKALEEAFAKAAAAAKEADRHGAEARREAQATADLWIRNAEKQKQVATKVKRDEVEFKLKLEQEQRETLRQRQKEITAQMETVEKHKESIREKVEMEARIEQEKKEAHR